MHAVVDHRVSDEKWAERRAKYAKLVDIMRANAPDSGGAFREADAQLRAEIAADQGEAADRAAQAMALATWALVAVTAALVAATVVLVVVTARA